MVKVQLKLLSNLGFVLNGSQNLCTLTKEENEVQR